MLNYRYIRFLLQKRQQEPLSGEEEQLIEQWYQSLDTMPGQSAGGQEEMKQHSWEQLQAIIGREQVPARRMLPWKRVWWAAAAAVLLLIAGGKYFYRSAPASEPAWVMLECPTGKRLRIGMADGSTIWLNSGSRLHYHPSFPQQREISIDDGEVFFEVAKDAAHPFLVHTKSLSVRVLGTAFNVTAYTQLDVEKVSVAEGSVQVRQAAREVVLHPDQQLVYNRSSNGFKQQEVMAAQTNSWRKGDIYLTNVTLAELALTLENIYGYEIEFSNSRLKNCVNSLHFNDKEPITKVLDLLKLIDNITYTISNKRIIIAGKAC
ncbi:FecR family protein [Chitinophaga solisilvae]|uniref:DUF4974 domain-containing protein n=1 Tax=Chitinophaga solisilvae TaxID=1233460 RepID=A0A3S1CY45_9BACT|nr:FecR family protein [Chitinophaga solisilvae]NSL87995.1 DUF4974 domain-containing protein [Chitinophaga solisilvae]